MHITADCIIDAPHALALISLSQREDVYHALRALFVTRHIDLALFDEAFRVFWRRPTEAWTTHDLQSLGESRRQPLPRTTQCQNRQSALIPD